MRKEYIQSFVQSTFLCSTEEKPLKLSIHKVEFHKSKLSPPNAAYQFDETSGKMDF